MDFGLISIAGTAISTAKDIGKAAMGLRDFSQVAAAMSQINDQLLKAQDSLFAHNAQIMALQQENFEAREELRKLKEALAQRARYSLFELSSGVFVYRMNVTPQLGGPTNPGSPEPTHYVCQPCFDKGIKSILRKCNVFGSICMECTICKERFDTGDTEPYR